VLAPAVTRRLIEAYVRRPPVSARPTVKTHVARIPMKLGLRDRVQVVVYAHEHDLL
jgi:hypothetical protein